MNNNVQQEPSSGSSPELSSNSSSENKDKDTDMEDSKENETTGSSRDFYSDSPIEKTDGPTSNVIPGSVYTFRDLTDDEPDKLDGSSGSIGRLDFTHRVDKGAVALDWNIYSQENGSRREHSLKQTFFVHEGRCAWGSLVKGVTNVGSQLCYETSLPVSPHDIARRQSLTPDEQPLPILQRRYKVEFEELDHIGKGKGAFGEVTKVRHLVDKNLYAVKKIPLLQQKKNPFWASTDASKTPHLRLNAIQEVATIARLNQDTKSCLRIVKYYAAWYELHPSVPGGALLPPPPPPSEGGDVACLLPKLQVRELGELQQCPVLFIQMELCEKTLHDWIVGRDLTVDDPYCSISCEDNMKILTQMLEGIVMMHGKGVLHRDLKPTNIFLTPEQDVKIGDFGLSRDIGSESIENNTITDAVLSCGVGTPSYMAPEVETGKYTLKADMFSFGVIMNEMFHPFQSHREQVRYVRKLRTGFVADKVQKCWPEQTKIILQLLSKDPDKRPTASELLKNPLFVAYDQRNPQDLRDNVEQLKKTSYEQREQIKNLEAQLRIYKEDNEAPS